MRGRVLRIGGVWDADRVQAGLNVLGGLAFAAGSLLFLDSSLMRFGVVLFVMGSFAMAFGALAVWRQRYARGPRAGAGPAVDLPLSQAVEPAAQAEGTPANGVAEPSPEQTYLRAS